MLTEASAGTINTGSLGGFTGGFNKTGVNPAAQWLQEQQNKDIEAQRSRMDQQKTLLGANQELYKDAILGEQATRLNMNDILDHQIQLQSAKSGSLQAQAVANKARSDLAFERGQILQSMGIRKTVLDATQNGGAGVTPLLLGHAGFMSPEEAQKEQSAVDSHKNSVALINQIYTRNAQLQTASQRLGHRQK